LADGLRAHGHRMVRAVDSLDDLCQNLRDLAAERDMIICMGAGDITKWAAALAQRICNARANK
jgi:UDP-N-acetylmuramate--alanine ligase